jgi:hypothetical protein
MEKKTRIWTIFSMFGKKMISSMSGKKMRAYVVQL